MRLHAEHELLNLSMDGDRGNSTPSPDFGSTFSDKQFGSPSKKTSTPLEKNGDILRDELDLARDQNKTVSNVKCYIFVRISLYVILMVM